MKSLFGTHIHLTGRVLDMRLKRQNVVSSNLANVKTPGYKARRVEFEERLQAALDLDSKGRVTRTDKMHLPAKFDPNTFGPDFFKSIEPRVYQGEDAVDLDKEMAIMAKNTLMYNALTQVMQKNFEGLKTAITEGGR
ncbi:flagellar basal body rod protein FlgB [Desulfonatronovibrio hydrogenovorans]|uniref:flagellar basal body rod protein FlgB n=1 Tax=Desulfonatronovibrio hydrogenovorans TaxID=53245 RepID=UPI000492003A|nr:flagellar basal body rod protein FlgB [Desulfonatronovibrio hydrogenovorans]